MRRPPPSLGERGRRFTLQLPIETPDGFGGAIRSFQPGPLLWGAMEILSADERLRAGRPEAVVTHRITFRSHPGLLDGMQLALGLRRFRITSAVDPDGRGRELVCLAEEIRP